MHAEKTPFEDNHRRMTRIVFFIAVVLINALNLFGQEVAFELKVLEMERIDWHERRAPLTASKSAPSVNRESFAIHMPESVARSLESSADSKLIHNLRFQAPDRKYTRIRFDSHAPQGAASVDVGIALELTPKVFANREMDINVSAHVEVRTDPEPSFTTQQIKHVVHISDGETIIVGGFVNDAEARLLAGIPTLRENPMLHYLFSEKRGQRGEPEIVLMLKPHIGESLPITRVEESPTNSSRDGARAAASQPINTVAAPSPKDTRPLYTIQVGAFEKAATAEALVARLKMRYDAVFIDSLAGERPVYRVRVGRLANLRAAGELERQLRTEGFQPFIVPPSQFR
jgi:Bacterial type II and III secretion system protein/SPOR domain